MSSFAGEAHRDAVRADVISHEAVAQATRRLAAAHAAATPCEPVRDLLGSVDVDSAYQVQRGVVTELQAGGAVVVGRKIGMTSAVVQRQLGVDQPDFGTLLDIMRRPQATVIELGRLIAPKVEAEVAFLLAEDLDAADLTAQDVLDATAYVCPALEIVDSRIREWDITIVDTVADNGSAALFVLGEDQADPRTVDLAAVAMRMDRNGTTASTGTGADCMGSPVNSVLWLARTAHGIGDPLRRGSVILSGALGPMVPIVSGDAFEAHITGIGSVTTTFGAQR